MFEDFDEESKKRKGETSDSRILEVNRRSSAFSSSSEEEAAAVGSVKKKKQLPPHPPKLPVQVLAYTNSLPTKYIHT